MIAKRINKYHARLIILILTLDMQKHKYHHILILRFLAILILLSSSMNANATNDESLPLWEVGLGAGVLHQSYYTGTKQTRSFVFPVVLPVYRGKVFKSDDQGLRAQLFKSDRYKLDFSMDFNLAIESDDIDLRKGMDDIDNILQLGPSLEVQLKKDQKNDLVLILPLRSVLSIGDDGVNSSGFNVSPSISYHRNTKSF